MSWDKLNRGDDPECAEKKSAKPCTLSTVAAVTGLKCEPGGEYRCFMPSNDADSDRRLLTPPRELNRPYLFAWAHARILAVLGYLHLVYSVPLAWPETEYAVVPRK